MPRFGTVDPGTLLFTLTVNSKPEKKVLIDLICGFNYNAMS